MTAEDFALQFEERLRVVLISAAQVAGPETALLACLNSGINYALATGLTTESLAGLLRQMADQIEANARDLGAPDPATLN